MTLLEEMEEINDAVEVLKKDLMDKTCLICEREHPFYVTCLQAEKEAAVAMEDELIDQEIKRSKEDELS